MPETHTFGLVLGGVTDVTDELEDALFEAGCDDATLSAAGRAVRLEFDREAETFESAVLSAVRQVEGSNGGALVLRVEPDDWVSASDVARRAGVSREAVRLWVAGERGPSGFPPRLAQVGQSPVWSWYEVAQWLTEHHRLAPALLDQARVTAALNRLLEARRRSELQQTEVQLEAALEGVS